MADGSRVIRPAPYAPVAVVPPVVYPYAAPYVGVVAPPYYYAASSVTCMGADGTDGRHAHGYGWH